MNENTINLHNQKTKITWTKKITTKGARHKKIFKNKDENLKEAWEAIKTLFTKEWGLKSYLDKVRENGRIRTSENSFLPEVMRTVGKIVKINSFRALGIKQSPITM